MIRITTYRYRQWQENVQQKKNTNVNIERKTNTTATKSIMDMVRANLFQNEKIKLRFEGVQRSIP